MSFLSILCLCTSLVAQDSIEVHRHAEDSTDVFYRHLKLNEVTVTGVVGSTKLKYATAPLSPSLGFSRQEHWSGLPFPSPMHETEK